MKNAIILVFSFLMLSIFPSFSQVPSTKAIHKEMHSQLLANAKNSIDKSVIQDYIKAEFEAKEAADPIYGNLSRESIMMITDLLTEAKTHQGVRYRSGGKGPDGFDCSGFTSFIYKQFGYKIDASSRGQFSNGEAVSNGALRPGDLVFFSSPRSGQNVGHVGIVVNADNDNNTFTFIHSASGKGIEIQSSTAPYYQRRYLGARRIITE